MRLIFIHLDRDPDALWQELWYGGHYFASGVRDARAHAAPLLRGKTIQVELPDDDEEIPRYIGGLDELIEGTNRKYLRESERRTEDAADEDERQERVQSLLDDLPLPP